MECGGNLLAYIAYGWKPTGASAAVAGNFWESADSFVLADFDKGFNQGLFDGQRLALQKDSSGKFLDARHVGNWKFYRAWEEPGENPMPVVLSPVFQYDENDVDAGEVYRSSAFGADSKFTGYNFNSNSELKFDETGEFNLGALKFQSGAKFFAPTESVVLHVGGNFQWNGAIAADDMISAAKHIMVYYHGSNRVFIQTDFAGTIIAPNAEVVVGQSGKNFIGAIYVKGIVVHQDAKITWAPFVQQNVNGVFAKKRNDFVPFHNVVCFGVARK